MKVQSLLGTAIAVAYASFCSPSSESRAEPVPALKATDPLSVSSGVFTSAIKDLHLGIKEADQRFYVDGTLELTYIGKDPLPGPVNWIYSLCFGEPAKDDAVTACVDGGGGMPLEQLVQGGMRQKSFHLSTRTQFISTRDKTNDPQGLKSPRGYTPHITVLIGEGLSKATLLLTPIGDYK